MTFNWFTLIVLFGILQGLLTAVLLVAKPKTATTSNKLLAAVIFVFSLLSFKIAVHLLGLWDTRVFKYFPLAIDLLIQPLLYLYVLSLVRINFMLKAAHTYHFLPAAIFMLHALLVYALVLPVNSLAAKDTLAERWHYNAIKVFEDDLSVISTIIYGVLSFIAIQRYRIWLNANIYNTAYATFTWLKILLIFTGLLGIGLLINVALDQLFHFNAYHFLHWQLFYIYLSVLIYYIAFKAYQQDKQPLTVVQLPAETHELPSKYTLAELQAAQTTIMHYLTAGKLYLDVELTLNALAGQAKLSPALVSAAINKQLGKPFRTLINELRVEEVKLKLQDSNLAHLSILGIALDCGFNSEASFYRIFKSVTGLSPKGYLAQIKNSSATPLPRIS